MLRKHVAAKTGEVTFSISSVADAKAAIELMKERTEAINEIEEMMEEEYELSTLRKESMALMEAVKDFVLKRDKPLEVDNRRFTIVKQHVRKWNPEKLQSLLPKAVFMKVATMQYVVDPERLDSLIRAGEIDRKKIESAFEESPKAPYVKHSILKPSDNSGEEEADRVAEALDS